MQVVSGIRFNSNIQLLYSQKMSSMNTTSCAGKKSAQLVGVHVRLRGYFNGARSDHGSNINRSRSIPLLHANGANDRIREALHKVELSISSYDTAWVAMVPSPLSLKLPQFPECLDWILDNQHPNGSWGPPRTHPLLIKDALSSTLACILALRTWNVGEKHVEKALHYIGSNFSSTRDGKLHTPIGFDIIFPTMIRRAIEMGLDLPMNQTEIDALSRTRDLELKRGAGEYLEGRKAYHAYIAEGLSGLQDWKEVMKFQKKNGSHFNSPSATAAVLIHTKDEKSLDYLRSVVQKFGNAVPTIYPLDIFTRLCIIDNLERFGISRHFSSDIKNILDRIYRCWVEKDDEIYSDITTCAMAFRILRMYGYDVSSDALAPFEEVKHFRNTVQGHMRDTTAVLELFKASQIKISENDRTLQEVSSWSKSYLKEETSTGVIPNPDVFSDEVNYFLSYPFYANLERLEHRRNIEHCNVESFQLRKTSYSNCIVSTKDLLNMAVEDFDFCQTMYHEELEHIESWVKDSRLDQLEFVRQKQAYCYFSAAATLFAPEMSDARIYWAKNCVLTIVVDDFFDIGASREEMENLITLIKKWDGNHEKEFCSEQVKIVFSALYATINELGAKAWKFQKRSVTDHVVAIWLQAAEAMMKEAEWLRNKTAPTLEEYMKNAYASFALGPIILPTLYFVGPEISEDIVRDPEYHMLYQLMSTCGRLLNDNQTFEREEKEGKLNSVTLLVHHGGGSTSVDEARRDVERAIESGRTELLKMVLRSEGSVVPRVCKDVFWAMHKVLSLFYMRIDGLSSPKEMMAAVHAVIHEPLDVSLLGPSERLEVCSSFDRKQ